MAKRKSPPRKSRKPARKPARRSTPAFALPKLEPHHVDLIGLGLVGLAAFFAPVFYLGWDGGKVGEALAGAFVFVLGDVAYLVPIAFFATGTLIVMRPLLPTLRPFRAGAICLVLALLLGLAGTLFGLGPSHPPRAGFFHAEYFREHGGIAGEALYYSTSTLFSRFGSYLIFVFLLVAGVLLLTGASIAGVIAATRESVTETRRRVRESTERPQPEYEAAAGRAWADPLGDDETVIPADVEPRVRATHVEAPAPEWLEDAEAEAEAERESDSELTDEVFEPPPPPEAGDEERFDDDHEEEEELTPMGKRRSSVTESDEIDYRLPSTSYLRRSSGATKINTKEQERLSAQLVEALGHFGVDARVVGTVAGPHVTRYELRLAPGIKMSKVAQLKDDLAYALAATDVRILAPIPGKTAVGVEVPNMDRKMVHLGDVYQEAPKGWSPLTVWLGKDIAGKAIGTDLSKQPHILVAGTTGSGKSGCVNAMLSSILLRATPNEVRLVLVDPKQVELNHYEHVPHLLTPVVTSPRLAANVLANLIKEMEERYAVMAKARTRNLIELNKVREREGERALPYILCVIDELADLMMVAPGEVEDSIIRLAQKSRAVGIHLLLATQRPSADIITGMIKANVPARIAFAVSSQTDSRVILDQNGAESLLGQGDMLFRPATESRPARIQGAFIDEEQIERITSFWAKQGEPEIQEELLEAVETEDDGGAHGDFDPDADDMLAEAISTVVQMGTASTSMLQRRLRVGYTRAGRLIDMMERRGVISGYEGSKARQVLITEGDLPRVLAALNEPVGAATAPADAG
jgi:S-DNA-T family DNA segregation ATPase FtsK/SpoIIIE